MKNSNINRRSFLKSSALAGGGLMISFSWMAQARPKAAELLGLPDEWTELNGYLKIGSNGLITIRVPNPEFGQNVRTSMPMIVADELDADWEKIVVEQAPFNTERYDRQMSGGSQGIRLTWMTLRKAGASARYMLKEAAAKKWNVPVSEISTGKSLVSHRKSGKSAGYGELASAASEIKLPENIELKDVNEFNIISTSKKNVDALDIVTGKPMFGMDYKAEGMLIAMIIHPPAFGMRLKSYDGSNARAMPGITDVFSINTFPEDFERGFFDANAFPELVVVVGKTTWEVMNAKKEVNVEWEKASAYSYTVNGWGRKQTVDVPSGLENTSNHRSLMQEMDAKPGNVRRKDGNPEEAFKNAAKVIERSYSAPFLAHNCMEPMNFFAHVTDEKAVLAGPLQAPEMAEDTLANRLGMAKDKIEVIMTRMGGGFGRRAYGHYPIEAALISKKIGAPVKMVYTREDDMTDGIYRPSYYATYRAALDENNNLIAFHVKAGGIPESPLSPDRFPAGSVDNYLAEEWSINSNITIGAFRAPRSNFIGGVEQSFLDEVAEAAGKDPIQFRLDLLDRARKNPVGENNDYDPERYAGVLKLVRDKSGWNGTNNSAQRNRGVAAYFCHNSYVAHVVDVVIENGKPRVQDVFSAVDCGIVVNRDAAANMVEGAVVDGIGNALYGNLPFKNGAAEHQNFNTYRMIRMGEEPEKIEVSFVENDIDPTGLGEPPFPPIFGALANALYKATGRRYYDQPFIGDIPEMG
ncbi:MAG: molybdopterin-dependent oxidoreductase [Cyclobacteriaceae bacterium]